MVLIRQRSCKECRLYQYGRQKRDSENHFSAIPAVASGPAPLPEPSCREGRNARATGLRSRAFPNFPRQFTLENCRLPPASPQSPFGKPGDLSRIR
jgi:hypothetical protein